ncbi:MAG: GNAT family N-acetyltransferase [Promethearchaeota archaeon]
MTGEKSDIVIRTYRKSDHEATTQLMRELAETYNFEFDEAKWKETSGLRALGPGYKRITLIADLEGEVVGMGFVETKREETGDKVGFLAKWGVKKEFIGHGIGKRLFSRAIEILEKMGVDKIQINVAHDSNPKVLKLFEKVGFKPSYLALARTIEKK